MSGTTNNKKPLIELSLKESELRYRRLFEAAQDGILILDAETGAIADVNPFLINMLGYSREEFVKKPATSIFYSKGDRLRQSL